MNMPNFFIVGAAKAGTTSLYYYLKQHPEIYMSPIKEPNYFAKDINIDLFREDYKKTAIIDTKRYFSKSKLEELHLAFITEFDDYVQLFREVKNEKAIGEISNSYLYSKVAAKEIYKFNPNAKIIIILRDPIERAFSHYIMNLRDGFTKETDFIKEVISDYNKSQKGWGVSHLSIELGLYYEQVKRYLDIFPRDNIKIILFDDFKRDTEKVVREIFKFLNINENVPIDFNKKANVGAVPKSVKLNYIIMNTGKLLKPLFPNYAKKRIKNIYKNLLLKNEKPNLSSKQREALLPFFIEDIKKTQELINRDLSMWLRI
jgi:hypothetical protein